MAYEVTEIFYSLQGEGQRKGSANVFVRFAGCNLCCKRENVGFDCDTDYSPHLHYANADDLVDAILTQACEAKTRRPCRSVILTGGEPMMQVDGPLLDALEDSIFHVAIETNGTLPIPVGVPYVTVSPKPDTELQCGEFVEEVRVVMTATSPPPDLDRLGVRADNYYVSPAFDGSVVQDGALLRCLKFCLDDPRWRLSLQDHKYWGTR